MTRFKAYAFVKIFTKYLLLILYFLCLLNTVNAAEAKKFQLKSPDETIEVVINIREDISFSVRVNGQDYVTASKIAMFVDDNQTLGKNAVIKSIETKSISEIIKPIVKEKFALIKDNYNELKIDFERNFSIYFRVYNNGIAYRFHTNFSTPLKINNEEAYFKFNATDHIYFPEEESFFSHNERTYLYESLDTLAENRLASMPLLVETQGPKILFAESDLYDYPGLWLKSFGENMLKAVFPHFPIKSELKKDSDRDMPVTEYADYIAKTDGIRDYPWRILAIARKDADLLTNQLVYQLAGNLQLEDVSWIKPGKVAWDWWNANNIYDVDFKSGVNTKTYKYYIDFASKFGIDYVILDEGWYKKGNLLEIVSEMDVQELISYGKQKNVGIILWVIWKTLDDQLQEALDQFEKWGAAGIKVDFMQRDDQEMVNYYWKIAEEAAKRKMLVDFHGAYKPSGLRRAFPNVISREGVKGLEWNKWSSDITSEHNLTLPFIRMVPGPMDYTPGAMVNVQPDNFNDVFERPMSMTTRAQQIAMYIIYESPLQMMADSPSNYLKEKECTEFISRIPTTWDETIVLDAKITEYLVLARKNANKWYFAAMANQQEREFSLDLSFIGDGEYSAEIIQDGINANRFASDYKKNNISLTKNDTLKIKLAPNGGWAMILTPNK